MRAKSVTLACLVGVGMSLVLFGCSKAPEESTATAPPPPPAAAPNGGKAAAGGIADPSSYPAPAGVKVGLEGGKK